MKNLKIDCATPRDIPEGDEGGLGEDIPSILPPKAKEAEEALPGEEDEKVAG
ncbi:MAG: hypothetical protein V4674_01250 [Patescibacteria group bacterium]